MSQPAKPYFFTADVTVSDEGDGGRFAGIGYSGGRIPQWNAVIDLASTRVAKDMPLMWEHGRQYASPIGIHTEAANDGRKFTVAGDLFGDIDPQADMVRKKSKRGLKWQMSVGVYETNDEFIAAGKSIQINGQSFQGPLLVLRDGIIRETSIVTLGGDPNTNADVFSAAQPQRSPSMSTPEEMQARIAALEKQVADQTERATTAENALAENKRVTRLASVKDLFAATKREFSEEKAKPYLEMSDSVYEAVAIDMKAAAPGAPSQTRRDTDPHLFREHATGAPGAGGGKSPLLADAEARGWAKK